MSLLLILLLAQQPPEQVLSANLENAFEGQGGELLWSTHVLTLTNLTQRDLDVTTTLARTCARVSRRDTIPRGATVRLQIVSPNLWAFPSMRSLSTASRT